MIAAGTRPLGIPHLYEVNYPGQVGYLVKLCRRGKRIHRIFNLSRFASESECRRAAEAFAREVDQLYPKMSRRERAEARKSHFHGEVVGVRRITRKARGHDYIFWQATWSVRPGVVARKYFSVLKFGEEEAKTKAVAARAEALGKFTEEVEPRSIGHSAVDLDVTLL